MGRFGLSQPVRRREDPRLLRGEGRFIDDSAPAGALHGVAVRAPLAHARITGLDVDAARAAPGVRAVYTGADLAAAGIGPVACVAAPPETPWAGLHRGEPFRERHQPALAADRVRFVGECVAFVVADTRRQALDAGERVEVDYDPLSTVTACDEAPRGAPVWDDVPDNVCFRWEIGDAGAAGAAFASAHRIVRRRIVDNRAQLCPLETRGAIAEYDGGRWTLHVPTQMPHGIRRQIAEVFRVEEARFRVLVQDVGGSFGGKNSLYPEQILCAHAARDLGRPVKWIADRSEAFLGDNHGRDLVSHGELALDAEHRIVGLRMRNFANLGAYTASRGAIPPTLGPLMASNTYRIPAVYADVAACFTHTVPTDPYRGAGRPEGLYVVERLMDAAGPRGWPGSGRAPPPKPGPARCLSVPDADRAPVRPVRIREGAGSRPGTGRGVRLPGAPGRGEGAGAAPRARHRQLRRALRGRGGAQRTSGAARGPGRRGDPVHRLDVEWPGARDRLQPDHPRAAGPAVREDSRRARGHRPGGERSRHRRLLVVADGRRRPRAGRRSNHRDREAARRRCARSGGPRPRIPRGRVPRRGDGPCHLLPGDRGPRRGGGPGPVGRRSAGPSDGGDLRARELHLPLRDPRLRGGGGPGDGGGPGHRLLRRARLRARPQPAPPRRTGTRRPGTRARTSPPGAHRLRRRGAAPQRLVHGLRHPARRRSAELLVQAVDDRLPEQSARHQGLRRSGGRPARRRPRSTPSSMPSPPSEVDDFDMPATPERGVVRHPGGAGAQRCLPALPDPARAGAATACCRGDRRTWVSGERSPARGAGVDQAALAGGCADLAEMASQYPEHPAEGLGRAPQELVSDRERGQVFATHPELADPPPPGCRAGR